METTPTVSVIVPVYNAGKTLDRCVGSLVAQSYKDIEIILVDDGSKDSSLEICERFSKEDPRVKVFHQENRGVSAARNLGLSNAVGEWVAFCDSDDMAGEHWISSMLEVSDKADLVIGGYNIWRYDLSDNPAPEAMTLGKVKKFTESDAMLECLLRERLFQFVWNKLFSRALIERYGLRFNESFCIFEDEYFVLEYISWVSDVICIPQCEYNYYHPADFMTKYDFGIDAFQAVVELIYKIVADVPGKIRLPSIIYWYKVALKRYAATHSYKETKDRIVFARKLAANFNDGPFSHLTLRILPPFFVYRILKRKDK